MFKKLTSLSAATLMLTVGLSILGSPASQASNPGAAVAQVNFSNQMTTTGSSATFTLPSGLSTFGMNTSFLVGTTSTTAARGMSMTGSVALTDTTNTNLSGVSNVGLQVTFYDGSGAPISVNGVTGTLLTAAGSLTVPSTAATINIYSYIGQLAPSIGSTFTSGTYTFTPSIAFNGTALPLSTTTGALNLMSGSASWTTTSPNFTNPTTASSSENETLITCVNTSLVHAGDALTAHVSLNGSNTTQAYFNYFDLGVMYGSPLSSANTYTLTTANLSSVIYVAGTQTLATTPNLAITSDISLTDNGIEVSQSCAPNTPVTPSLAITNGMLTGTINNPNNTDSYKCNFYDSSNPSTIANSITVSGTISPRTCPFSGAISNHSYTMTAIAIRNFPIASYLTLSSAASAASTALTVPAAAVALTPPSGNSTAGSAKQLSTQISVPAGSVSYSSVSDGGDGLLYSTLVPTTNSGCSSNCESLYVAKVGHLTTTGADSTFAGTGIASPDGTYSVPFGLNISSFQAPSIGWFGNRDHWASALNNSILTGSGITLSSGVNNSASISQVVVASSTLNAFCSSTFGTGMFQTMTAVSMNSAVPVWRITCYAPSGSVTLPNNTTNSGSYTAAALVTIPNSTAIIPIVTLGGLQTALNTFTFVNSVNPTAGSNDASLTGVLVTGAWASGTTQNVVSRKIIRITPALVVTQENSNYSTQTLLNNNSSEPTLVLEPINSGTIYLTKSLAATSTISLATIGTSGDVVAGQTISFDSASMTAFPFSGSTISFRGAAQTASTGNVYIMRVYGNPSLSKIALQKINLNTGQESTGEIISYVAPTTNSTAFLNSSYISASGDAFWYFISTISPSSFSLVQWTALDQIVSTPSPSAADIAAAAAQAAAAQAAAAQAAAAQAAAAQAAAAQAAAVQAAAVQAAAVQAAAAQTGNAPGDALRQAAVSAARARLVQLIHDKKPVTITDYTSSDIAVPSVAAVARINTTLQTLQTKSPTTLLSTDAIKSVIQKETVVDMLSNQETKTSVLPAALAQVGLLDPKNPNKTSIILGLRTLPESSLDSYDKVAAAIAAQQAAIQARKDKQAAALARHKEIMAKSNR